MRHTTLALLKISAIVGLGLLAGASGAQQSASGLQAYDVELVLFRILSSNATPEEWATQKSLAPQQLTVPDDESQTAAPAVAPPLATSTATFPSLPASKFKLTAVHEALKRSRNYQSLGHFGWTQPGFPRTEAHYMSIDSQVAAGLTGRVALSRGRYLHLTLDLVLEGADAERFILQHTRRMRSNERHYIDHPKFGVIALITPVQN